MDLTGKLRLVSVVLVAITMAAGFAHLLELPNKIGLPAFEYLNVQQIYRGWALIGIVIFAALAATSLLAVRVRRDREAFVLTLATIGCLVLSLVVFFAFTFPVNQATRNWTILPDNWQDLRRRWEYSHAVNAGIYLLALVLLTRSLLTGAKPSGSELPDQERRRGITTPRSSAAPIASS